MGWSPLKRDDLTRRKHFHHPVESSSCGFERFCTFFEFLQTFTRVCSQSLGLRLMVPRRWRTTQFTCSPKPMFSANKKKGKNQKSKIQSKPRHVHISNNLVIPSESSSFLQIQTYQTAYLRVCMKTASPTASTLVSSVAVLHPFRIPLHKSGNSAAVRLAISSFFKPSLKSR